MIIDEQHTFEWDISKLESTDGIVTRVFWTLWGFDRQGNRAPLYGDTALPLGDNTRPFIPYNSLTKKEVENFLEEALGEDEVVRLTDNLTIQLKQLEESAVVTEVPPWLNA